MLFVPWFIADIRVARSDIVLTRFAVTQGSKSNAQVLESFAHNLSEAFVNGELCVGDWEPDMGAKINVNLVVTFFDSVR